jgi:hypothetical protein
MGGNSLLLKLLKVLQTIVVNPQVLAAILGACVAIALQIGNRWWEMRVVSKTNKRRWESSLFIAGLAAQDNLKMIHTIHVIFTELNNFAKKKALNMELVASFQKILEMESKDPMLALPPMPAEIPEGTGAVIYRLSLSRTSFSQSLAMCKSMVAEATKQTKASNKIDATNQVSSQHTFTLLLLRLESTLQDNAITLFALRAQESFRRFAKDVNDDDFDTILDWMRMRGFPVDKWESGDYLAKHDVISPAMLDVATCIESQSAKPTT